jgi:DNA-binding NtrC family response regulator
LKTHLGRISPLRERKGDITFLLAHFLEEAAKEFGKKKPTVPKELFVLLSNYSFPGNVRELKSMIFDAVSIHKSKMLSMEPFVEAMGMGQEPGFAAGACIYDGEGRNMLASLDVLPPLKSIEKLLIEEALRRTGGVQGIAARLLGISAPALTKRLRSLHYSEADKDEVP